VGLKCCHVGDGLGTRISYLCLEKSVDNGCRLMFVLNVNDDNGCNIIIVCILYVRQNERDHFKLFAITTGNRLVTAFERFVFSASYLTARGRYIKREKTELAEKATR